MNQNEFEAARRKPYVALVLGRIALGLAARHDVRYAAVPPIMKTSPLRHMLSYSEDRCYRRVWSRHRITRASVNKRNRHAKRPGGRR